jgi:hypothetical protein
MRFNPVTRAEKIKMLHELPEIDQPKEKRNSIAQSILEALGDQPSHPFYLLVASKVPERVIRYALAAIKANGARHPARVFTYRMQQYALAQHKKRLFSQPAQPPKKRL